MPQVRPPLLISSLALLLLAPFARADLTVQTLQPYRQDRFYTATGLNPPKAFLGQAFDWSGVGQSTTTGTWATMISPTYFLSANHFHPGTGETLTFYQDNTTDHPHSYTVAAGGLAINSGGTTDLWLGQLTSPIPSADHITSYPVLDLPTHSNYLGLEIYVNGKPNRVGRNNIDSFDTYSNTNIMLYDYNTLTGLGADEAYIEPGDSGGPSFYNAYGALALVGLHFVNEGPVAPGLSSGDTFVPDYISQLDAAMVGDQVLTVAPEPAALSLLALGALSLLSRRRPR